MPKNVFGGEQEKFKSGYTVCPVCGSDVEPSGVNGQRCTSKDCPSYKTPLSLWIALNKNKEEEIDEIAEKATEKQ